MAGSLLMGVGAAANEARDRTVTAMDALRVADTSRNADAGMGQSLTARHATGFSA